MPVAPRVTAQDPSLSPTYGLSNTQTERTAAPSIRRNLFSAHLSRRPVSSTTSSLFGPSSPVHQNAQSRHDTFSSGPTLHPTKRVMDLKDIYDPNASPPNHHGGSPSAASNLFPRESIIAVNPLTGRPLLPNLPTLPPRLRLSEDDDDDEGSDEDMEHHEYLEYGAPFSRSPSRSRNFLPSSDFDFDPDIDLDSSDLNFIGIPRGQNVVNTFMDTADSDDSRGSRERIERLLADMMSKQRARARTLNVSDSTVHLGVSNSTPSTTSSGLRGRRAGRSRDRRADTQSSRFELFDPLRPPISKSESMCGGAGASMDPLEKDELMGLIMTSLRRRLQQAEDEGWMYGGAAGLGGIGMNAELGGDGLYD